MERADSAPQHPETVNMKAVSREAHCRLFYGVGGFTVKDNFSAARSRETPFLAALVHGEWKLEGWGRPGRLMKTNNEVLVSEKSIRVMKANQTALLSLISESDSTIKIIKGKWHLLLGVKGGGARTPVSWR